jgi:hypothetical protein
MYFVVDWIPEMVNSSNGEKNSSVEDVNKDDIASRPKTSESSEDIKALKRAEIERNVLIYREKAALEKEKKRIAEQERAAQQEKETKKQSQLRELLLQAQSEKDEEMARIVSNQEQVKLLEFQEMQSSLRELEINPLQKIMSAKVALRTLFPCRRL